LEAKVADDALTLVEALRAALASAAEAFMSGEARASDATRVLAATLEVLTNDLPPQNGAGSSIWKGQAGAALAAALTSLIEESDALPPVSARGFAQLLESLLQSALVRPGGATHPRLKILGVLEARLAEADLIILAGLEEGVWPRAAPIDPFLSRPMRRKLGLPSPERRIGLAAHDFAQAACASEVVLLHTERRDGAPTVQSRWLWRLRTLISGAGIKPPERAELLTWARALDEPLADPPPALRTARRPRPRPPLASRPRRLSVTAVERWIRDPYAVYAQRILGLKPLDPPDKPIGGAERGTAIHNAFQRFAEAWPDDLPPDAAAAFEGLVLDELGKIGMPLARMPREAALARNLAPWVVEFERRRREGRPKLLVEQSGSYEFVAPGGAFTLSARADRIELRGESADILDFKTGMPPSKKQVKAGLAPQLTLTAAILAAGGFETAGPLAPGELLYVRVTGRREPGSEEPRDDGAAAELAATALAGLVRRVARFDDEGTAYVSRAATQFMHEVGDFDPLARVWEWAVIGEAEL
jgi:ATP-dependent helicase/nuclease subunit B